MSDNFYIYAADILCESCGNDTIIDLLSSKERENCPEADCRSCGHKWIPTAEEFKASINRAYWLVCPECKEHMGAFDEYTYDSDSFPKYECNSSESDCPEHCSSCHEFMGNDLTSYGYEYVKEQLDADGPKATEGEKNEVQRVWAEFYGFHFREECSECGLESDECECKEPVLAGEWVSSQMF